MINISSKTAFALKRLTLGVGLILLASAVILFSDSQRKRPHKTGAKEAVRKIAILKFSSRQVLDESVDGILEGLKSKGYENGRNISIKEYNPENDLPTALTMAKSIVEGDFNIAITVSTPMLQTMASANKEGKVVHVFGTVTDPFGAGVGINRKDSFDRPAYMAGVGTFQPVKEVFRMAKKCRPELKTVGVVWCPSETCSEACLVLAREVCTKELGITLLEATVENTQSVYEAAESLVSRGAEAIWIGGDNIVEAAVSSVLTAAKKGRIPVFANAPGHAEKGALIGLGADYYEVGILIGNIAAGILDGKKPLSFPVENRAPEQLALNLDVITNLQDRWDFPDEILNAAAIIVEKGNLRRSPRKDASELKSKIPTSTDRDK